ncbi:MAG: glycosyltransferase family 2 protein [Sediminibacterium sp.]|nr:glycosyltransferase family 2 protein [Sediminibacterium sp.]
MDSNKSLTIGIASFNRPKVLRETVGNILSFNNEKVAEIIIIDQTTDVLIRSEQQSYFSNLSPLVKYYIQDVPHVSRARNTIILKAKSDIVLFIDDDVLLGKKCLEAHINSYINEKIGSVTGHIYHRLPNYPEDALSICEPHIGTENFMHGIDNVIVGFNGPAITCNQSFLKMALISVNGFDENFAGGYYEDADLGLRVTKEGYLTVFNPEALVLHLKSPSGGLRFTGSQVYNERVRLMSYTLFLCRHPFAFGFFKTLYAVLRVGPFRKKNIINPIRHFRSWIIFLQALWYGFILRNNIKSIIFNG